jgi:hypothetical protein
LKEEFNDDQVKVMNDLFADVMLDLWNDILFEDKHQSYPDMAV